MYIPAVVINLDDLYIMDNILDNLDFTDWMRGFQLSMSSIIMPKHVVADTFSMGDFEMRFKVGWSASKQHIICFFLNVKIIYKSRTIQTVLQAPCSEYLEGPQCFHLNRQY